MKRVSPPQATRGGELSVRSAQCHDLRATYIFTRSNQLFISSFSGVRSGFWVDCQQTGSYVVGRLSANRKLILDTDTTIKRGTGRLRLRARHFRLETQCALIAPCKREAYMLLCAKCAPVRWRRAGSCRSHRMMAHGETMASNPPTGGQLGCRILRGVFQKGLLHLPHQRGTSIRSMTCPHRSQTHFRATTCPTIAILRLYRWYRRLEGSGYFGALSHTPLGATYVIPIIYVPMLVITHAVALYWVVRPQPKAACVLAGDPSAS